MRPSLLPILLLEDDEVIYPRGAVGGTTWSGSCVFHDESIFLNNPNLVIHPLLNFHNETQLLNVGKINISARQEILGESLFFGSPRLTIRSNPNFNNDSILLGDPRLSVRSSSLFNNDSQLLLEVAVQGLLLGAATILGESSVFSTGKLTLGSQVLYHNESILFQTPKLFIRPSTEFINECNFLNTAKLTIRSQTNFLAESAIEEAVRLTIRSNPIFSSFAQLLATQTVTTEIFGTALFVNDSQLFGSPKLNILSSIVLPAETEMLIRPTFYVGNTTEFRSESIIEERGRIIISPSVSFESIAELLAALNELGTAEVVTFTMYIERESGLVLNINRIEARDLFLNNNEALSLNINSNNAQELFINRDHTVELER